MKQFGKYLLVGFLATTPFLAEASNEITVAASFVEVDASICQSKMAMDATNRLTMEDYQICVDVAPEMKASIKQVADQHPLYVTGHITGLLRWKKFVITSITSR